MVDMVSFPSLEDLREYVHYRLCRHADLITEAPLIEEQVQRKGQPCGISFVLIGPNSIRLSAIWDRIEDRLIFYDERFEKFDSMQIEGPDRGVLISQESERQTYETDG